MQPGLKGETARAPLPKHTDICATCKVLPKSGVICERQALVRELAPRLGRFLDSGALVFTDENVFRLYAEEIKTALPGVPLHVMPAGEEYKTPETLMALLEAMCEAGLRRGSTLIALGGGVVGDVGGLAASLYMRGISCIQVPTTLLAQADASIGGKTAVNFLSIKNLIGTIRRPEAVLCDPDFLNTLPLRELRSGLGEIVKHGALCGVLFEKLWENRDRLFEVKFLGKILPCNIAFKAAVVERDPYERGLRKCLNLGHTTAHMLEAGGFGLSHGECVLIGLIAESKFSEDRPESDKQFLSRLRELCLRALGEPPKLGLDRDKALTALRDKKNTAEGEVTLCIPKAAGKYELLLLPFEDYFRKIGELLC